MTDIIFRGPEGDWRIKQEATKFFKSRAAVSMRSLAKTAARGIEQICRGAIVQVLARVSASDDGTFNPDEITEPHGLYRIEARGMIEPVDGGCGTRTITPFGILVARELGVVTRDMRRDHLPDWLQELPSKARATELIVAFLALWLEEGGINAGPVHFGALAGEGDDDETTLRDLVLIAAAD